MNRIPHLATLLAVSALALLTPSAAHAQFGGLMNRAKEKVAEKAAEKMAPIAPGEQLTEDLLGKVITGAQAADRVLADRDAAQSQRDAKSKELAALQEKNAPVHQAYNEGNSKIMDCRSSSFHSLDEARQERMNKKVATMQSDPVAMAKVQLVMMNYAKAMADAQKTQDAVALAKAQQDMMAAVSGEDIFAELKKDSLAADAKCGKAPAMPASLMQEEQLQKDIAGIDDQLRTLEARAVTQGAQASGLEQVRYLQLKERALSIMNRMAGQGATVKFGDDEMNAVKRRQGDLEKVKRAL
ncbi:hypothetical protein BH09GEM1_BH09GEM1_40430 [soil metagenome]